MGRAKIDSADLVAFANLDTCVSPEDEILGECLYRAICLVAYGNDNGCFGDIEPFASIEYYLLDEWDNELESMRDMQSAACKVVLPYARRTSEQPLAGDLKIPKDYRNALNPVNRITSASREINAAEGYQIFSFHYEIDDNADNDESEQWAFGVAGQLIINAHIAPIYIGIYDGEPLFEPNTEADRLWLAFAKLQKHQFPGICAVCGKAIDRKRESGGGKPKKTCGEHSYKFQNEKRRLRNEAQKIGNTDLADAKECEMAVRAQRQVRSELNERPLRGITTDTLANTHVFEHYVKDGESVGDY